MAETSIVNVGVEIDIKVDDDDDIDNIVVERLKSYSQVAAIKSQIQVSQNLIQAHQEEYKKLKLQLETLAKTLSNEEDKVKELTNSITKEEQFRNNGLFSQIRSRFDNVMAELIFSYVSDAIWCDVHNRWCYDYFCWDCEFKDCKRCDYMIQGTIKFKIIDHGVYRDAYYQVCEFRDLEFYKFCKRVDQDIVEKDGWISVPRHGPSQPFALCLYDHYDDGICITYILKDRYEELYGKQ